MFSPLYLDNFISATRITPQVRKRARRARGPGSELPASEKRTVGSRGRLHHAAQSVWTHNVRPARKTGCYALGLKAVKTPVTGCESCQSLSALFPIAGARAANTAETISKERRVYVRKQKILLHEAQGKFLHQ